MISASRNDSDKLARIRNRGRGAWPALLQLSAFLLYAESTAAQIKDEVRVYIQDTQNNGAESLLRLTRKLELVGITSTKGEGGVLAGVCPLVVDGMGRSWIDFDSLNAKKLLRIDNLGVLLPSAVLPTNAVNLVIDLDGRAYASSRIGLSSPGPVHGVAGDGTLLWSNSEGPSLYNFGYPHQLAMTGTGELWLGDGTVLVSGQKAVPFMVRLDKSDGHVLDTLALPGSPTAHAGVCAFCPAADGTLWSFVCGGSYRWMFKTQGTTILASFPVNGGTSDITAYHMHVDAHDRVYVLSLNNPGGGMGSQLLRYDPAAPTTPDAVFQFGGHILGWELGASGEDAFAVIAPPAAPLTRRLARMNLTTGVSSSVPLDPTWLDGEFPYGDPTGFRYANVTDRAGDADGDGFSNGGETTAGTSPYDALSRPSGPKVYVSFALSNNALILKYVDPDGLINPTGGLDLSTLSVKLEPFGEVFHYLLPLLTFVQLSPDGTTATVLFGALPMASGLKRRLEARVTDKTGAVGWDWQVTPPGEL